MTTVTMIVDQMASIQGDNQCPLLFYYDNESQQCECISSSFSILESNVVCANDRGRLSYNFCMTYKEGTHTISASFCTYFALNGHNISELGFINLPENISELNDYMCGPMNRKGIVCSECIDGYGPSVTSPKFRCSDCTNAWYSVPLYLLLELVPITIFYLIVLIFQINLTSAPMPSFIFYSNIILISLNFNVVNQDQVESQALGTILALSYGIWTLDFFRFVIPPFCVSPNLKIIHAFYLQNVSTIFPFFLSDIQAHQGEMEFGQDNCGCFCYFLSPCVFQSNPDAVLTTLSTKNTKCKLHCPFIKYYCSLIHRSKC